MALLSFTTIEALQHALAEHSAELFAPIASYTDIVPVMQVSEVVE